MKHGHARRNTKSSTYNIWVGMRQRCNDPAHVLFHRYGGRGIRVCERWNSFGNFLEDMGERPHGMTIDRTDNDGHYEPDNCRWTTRAENRRNASHCKLTAENVRVLKGLLRSINYSIPKIRYRAYRIIGSLFGVSESLVSQIDGGSKWADIS